MGCAKHNHSHYCKLTNSIIIMLLKAFSPVVSASIHSFKSFNVFKMVIFDLEVRVDFVIFHDHKA